jgi:hypothetical protein
MVEAVVPAGLARYLEAVGTTSTRKEMPMSKPRLSKLQWVEQIFSTKAARNGGPVRRKVASVLRYASVEVLLDAARKRGFHVILTGEYFVILCNSGSISIIR